MVGCPTCGTEVQADWDWCHACGWDPEGLMPASMKATVVPPGQAPSPRPPVGPPPAAAGPGYAPGPGNPYAGYGPPPGPRRSSGTSALLIIGGVVGCVFLVAVLAILAVTFLGTAAPTSSFASVDGAITLPDDDAAVDGPSIAEQDADLSGAVWTTWTSPDGSYRVDFPAVPEVVNNPLDEGIVVDEAASADLGSTEYLSYHLVLSSDYEIPDATASLNRTLDLVGENGGITFSSRTPGSFNFLPSISFTGSVEGGRGTVQGVAFASNHQLYALMTVAFDGVLVDHDRFISSFATG